MRLSARSEIGLLIVQWLALLATAALLASARPARGGEAAAPPVRAVVQVGMTVEDMDHSVAFYTTVLDFEKVSDVEVAGQPYEELLGVFGLRCRIVRLRLGGETIELTEFLASRGRQIPRESRSNDRWFQHIAIATTDIGRGYRRLRANKVRHASTGPQRLPDWNPNAGGIKAFYFLDPDGHVLELIQFPPGKGQERWQQTSKLFAGIDHTAIVVDDTEKSLAFYRDALGMKIAGGSENYGIEQERLNNVRGARLHITTLKAIEGPGVELLEYLSPHDGRPYPADAQANDLWHWQTTIKCEDVSAKLTQLQAQRLLRSVGTTVELPEKPANAVVRDPDGHAVLLTEP